MADIHKRREDSSDSSNVDQVAEQAILAKNALGSAEHAGDYSGSSYRVEIWYNIRGAEGLEDN